ncbi:hypothetical protein SynBIOSE41_02446 [Synechococcus sp. BIOS-E4-1]|nr:hypothetical protein SynBIOSE41_02446 [Synechococcus sp. BIOS-E4-1]
MAGIYIKESNYIKACCSLLVTHKLSNTRQQQMNNASSHRIISTAQLKCLLLSLAVVDD